MAKQYKVLVNTAQAERSPTPGNAAQPAAKQVASQEVWVQQFSGDKGQPVRIKAQAGAKYELQEAGRKKPVGPDYVKARRVGKHLHILFEDEAQASLIIEDYYELTPGGYNGVIGQAENGRYYEYIPEDPRVPGLVPELADGGQAVNIALGGAEVTPWGYLPAGAAAAAGVPWLGALGLLGVAGAAWYLNRDDDPAPTPTNGISGKLSDTSDLTDGGNKDDDITRDNTPTLTGTAPVGSTATVTINGQTYPVTINPDGTWTFQQPTNLPDGTYYPILNVTQNGVTTHTNITPFTIDTTPPTIAITADKAGLASGETATVTFSLSEAVADFTAADIVVTGGTLSNFQRDPSNPLKYTATFTPTAGTTPGTATISVANDKFSDAAGNLNTDGADLNNTVTLTTNAPVTGALAAVGPNDSGPLGDNLTNDNTPTLKGKVPPGSNAKIVINGVEQTVTPDAQGNWTYTVPNSLPDGTYTPQLIVTPQGSSTPNAPVPLTPFTIDTVPPGIVVSAPTNSLVAGQTTPITFTLTEPVSDFGPGDVVVSGGTLSNFVQSPTDPKIYTATFTPDSTGTSATIMVPSGKFSDAAANFNTDGADTAPATTNTITLATNASASGGLAPASDNATGTPNDNQTNDATPELAGKVPVGSTAVIKIKDAQGNVVGEGPATVNPDGTWTFTQPNNLPDGTYSPEVIVNGGTPTPLEQFVIDTTPPTVAISAPLTTLAAGASTVVTFTVSEGTTDLTLADITVTGGTLGTLQQSASNPLVYTATYTSTSGGAGAVNIASNKFSDAAGNLNKDGAEGNNSWAFNNSGPTPTPDAATGALAPASDTGVMGDNKTNDTTPELKGTVPPGSRAVIKIKDDQGNVVGEGPATVNPDGTWSFTQPDNLPDGVYSPEVIVNGGTPTPITPFVIDTTPPTIFIQADKTQLLAGQTTTVTFTLSEAVTDFAWNATTQTGDITVSGGTLGTLTQSATNPKVYTATFTPTAGSTATSVIAVGNGNFSDAANNFNTDGADTDVLTNTNTLSIPTNTVVGGGTGFLSPDSDSGTPGDNITKDDTPTITGQVPPGSTASVNINGKDYPVTVNPDGSYSYTIPDNLPDGTYVPKIKVTPPGGGTPVVSDGTPFTIDTTPPTVLVTSDKTTLTTGQTATITFTLSEDSKDFTLADVTSTGGTLSNLQGSGKVYTATFTPSANSTTTSTVKVDSLKFSDAAGNFNVDGADTGVSNTNIVSMTTNTTVADTVRPTIAITADRSTLATGQTTLVTFTLSEPSSDFTAADINTTGGTLGTLVQSTTDPKVYTAVFTPTANSTTTSVISVASNKFSDAAGNFNNDGADANNTVSLPTNTTPGLVTGGLDPKSDTGTPGDNKTLDNTPTISGTAPPGAKVDVVINGKTYSTTADPNGQYAINVPDALPDGTYTPEIRVTPPGGPTSSTDGTPFTIDTTPPTIVVSSSATTLSAGQTATITFTLSEASTDFTLADVQVSGGTLSNFQGSGSSYTATFTPNPNSIDPSVVHVASAKFADAAGNANTDGTDANNTVSMVTNTLPPDTTAPTIVVARTNPTASLKHGDTETITFTLSEASTDFNVGDIDVTGGTLSNFTAIPSSGTAATGYTQYTATFTPTDNQANGSATVGVAAGKFKDNAGNANQDDYNQSGAENENNRVTFTYNTTTPDTTPPTVALSRTGTGSLTAGGSEVINIVLSEASKNFDLSDIVVTGGTLSGFAPVTSSGNATTGYTDYVVTFTPDANATGNATIGVAAGKFTDAANNVNKDTYSATASNGSVTSPLVETNNIVSLGYNTTTPDTTAPTVAVSRSGLGTVSSTETIYFTLSEASTDFALEDISVTGGQLSNFAPVASSGSPSTGYTQYQVTFTPTANSSGLAAVGVVAGTFRDAAGNANKDTFESGVSGTVQEANNAVSFNVNTVLPDNTAPTVAVGRSGTGIVTGPETITFTLSEASTTFAQEDISVTGGTLSGFAPVATSGSAATGYTEYTAVFTPAAGTSGSATVGVASDKFSDAAGNYNKDTFVAGVAGTTQEVNNSVSFNYNSVAPDTTPPTIVVDRLGSGTLSANASETIRFTISEATKDFTLADIVVLDASGNVITGTLSNLAAVPTSGTAGTGYTTYVATFTALSSITPASGMVTIGVASSKFSDAAGNFNKDTYTNPATGTDVYEANNKVDISYNTLSPSTDTTSPTVIVARAGSATLQTGGSETITFTLSEPSLGFDLSDVTVTGGGTLGNFSMVTSSGTPATGFTVYTATYTPPANTNSTTTIGVLSGKFSDAAGNLNKDTYASGVLDTSFETNNVVSVAYNTTAADTTAPKVEVLRASSGTITGPETIYFNFSEAINPASFTTSDIVATGGTISNLVPVTGSNNTQFIATFTPNATSTGTATIGVGASAVTDVAGNANTDTYDLASTNYEANNQVSASYDTLAPNPIDETPPTVAISRVGTGLVGSTGETLVFVFSEPVNGFTASDIVVTANGSALPSNQGVLGTVTEVAGSGGTQYTVSYTAPTGTVGSVTLGIKAGTFTDRATTPNANKDTYEANVADTVQEANNQLTLAWDTDTTAPTVVVTRAGSGTLTGSNTDTITFTLSEPSADFTQTDVTVEGGTLSNWTAVSSTVYTATFTPTPNNAGTALIGVRAGTFNDLGNNANADDYRLTGGTNGNAENDNNKVDIAFNTLGATFVVNNDTGTINEDDTAALTGNVKTNDSLVANVTSVSQGGTSGTLGTALAGTYGSLTLNADGSYSYVIDNTKPAVQALKAGQTVTEVFSYTGANTGATQNGSANLTITITGTNDAPVAVADTATAIEAGGTANGTAGSNATGNVLTNDTDVDMADTKVVSAIHAGSATGTTGDSAVAAGTPTVKAGTYGSISINADGSYTYTITDQNNSDIQALRTSGQSVNDVFTYTVKDGSNATHQATITVNITGANDAPTLTTTINDKTATAGTALTSFSVASNFADVDTTANGETATYSAKLVDSSGNLVNGGNLPSWLQIDPATGTFSGTPPAGTAAGDIYIRATRTDAGGLSVSDDFKITLAAAADTTPPTVAIVSNQASLSSGQTAVITFTFSEAVADFVWDPANPSATTNDIEVSGGTLDELTHVGVNSSGQDVYTATFRPTANSTVNGEVKVAAGKFKDLAATPNWNVDTYTGTGSEDLNNKVTLTVNTTVTSSLTLINDTATAKEAGVQNGGNTAEAGTNPSTTTQATGVLGNDTAATSVTAIAFGSASGTLGSALNGAYGSLTLNANGTYTYTVNNSNATVNALQVGSSLTEVFTYTATDGTTDKTANLTVTINGTNDAPTVAVALADQTGTVGAALSYVFDSGTFADVDTADTKTYTAQIVDSTGNTVISTVPATASGSDWLAFNATTRTFTGTPPAAGTTYVKVICTDSQGATTSDIFNIVVAAAADTTPPTIAITSDKTTLAAGQTATITFTLSEASTDFVQGDVTVTGGALDQWNAVSSTVYTARFTPDANSIADSVIHVASNTFSDAAATPNFNADGADANNTVTMVTNTMPADTTAPTIVVARTNAGATLNTGATETITFTLSEASTDFSLADIDVSGGTLSNFAPVPTSGTAGTGYTQYVVTFTPNTNSTTAGTVGVLSGKFKDNAGNLNQDTYLNATAAEDLNNQVTLTIDTTTANPVPDTTAPTVAVARAGSGSLTTGGTDTITFTLSEASTTFTVDDVDVVGGSLSNFAPVVTTGSAAGGYTVYTATFTPATGSGTATIGVVDGKFADAAGNTNKDTYAASPTAPIVNDGNNQVSIAYTNAADTTAPTVVVSRAGTGTVSTSETVYFTLSEASTTFALSDVTVNGGSLSNFVPVLTSGSASAGYTQYTATFTPATGSGTAFVGVASGTFSDAAGNTNEDTYDVDATSPLTYEANNYIDLAYNTSATDTTQPTIAITSDKATLSAGETALITFTLSEASTDFAQGDVTVTGGTLSGWIALSPTQYIATFTPAANSTANSVIHVDSDKFTDAATNANADGAEANNTVTMATDTTSAPVTDNPTIAISSSASTLANGQTATITFTLSEASSDFEWDDATQTGDIDVVGGTLGALSTTDNITYTATFIPTDNAVTTATIGVKAGKFTADATTLANLDTYEPFVSGTTAELDNIASINVNTDNTPPTVAVSQLTSPVTGPTTVTFTLSEASSDFTAADVYVTPGAGSLDNWTKVSDTVYTARFNPTADSSGSVIIGVASGKFTDAAGLVNKDSYLVGVSGAIYETDNSTDFTYNTDTTPPTIAITGPSGAVSGPTTITFTLSEVSSDFADGDITVTGGGTLSALVQSASDPKVYTATYTPPAGTGSATIGVASDKFQDAAGNRNADGGDLNNHLSVSYDTVPPTVAITTNNANGHILGIGDTTTVTFTFSEKVFDFTEADIVLTGGTLLDGSNVTTLAPDASSGDATTGYTRYTATFTPTVSYEGVGSIAIASSKFRDAAGNQNADSYLADNTVAENANNITTLAVDTKAPVQTVSFSSMTKDSDVAGLNNDDWTTADSSAGRLISGFLSAPLGAGETLKVYSNGQLIGNAVVNEAGTAWAITDTNGYGTDASWTYTAKVVDAAGNAGPEQTQVVNGDYTEAAPVITAVTDSASTSIAHNGSTANTLGSISGEGAEGHTIYLYDNTGTNLVGTAVVQAGGTWTITGLATNSALISGSNTFAAKQVDPLGNESVLSKLWTVTAASPNLIVNGDFNADVSGFTNDSLMTRNDTTDGNQNADVYGITSSSSWYNTASTLPSTPTTTGGITGGSYEDYETNAFTNAGGYITGYRLIGSLATNTARLLWKEAVTVEAGATYEWSFAYGTNTAGLMDAYINGQVIHFTDGNTKSGYLTVTYTPTTSGPIDLEIKSDGFSNTSGGDYVLDSFSFYKTAASAGTALTAGGTPPATPDPDNLTYTAGALDALESDDTITASSIDLQNILTAGGFIDGGAGIDTLVLASGTTLNLEAITANQTVTKIQEVEIFKMQGGSELRMSANDVLSLGGANASTMTPFSFASTEQVDDTAGSASIKATGSTSSAGKVQMVIQGTSTDTLKLDSLLTDGIANGTVLGNAGLAGTWAYKGTVQIGLTTYKVYDHSTTNAQVLVDVPVIVNAIDPINITTIDDADVGTTGTTGSNDTGSSASDFVTLDPTLVFKGTTPNLAAGEKVKIELLNASGNPIAIGSGTALFEYVTPSNNVWTFDNTAKTLAPGNYTIRATIVDSAGTTVASYGSMGVDTQPLTIDTTLPTILVSRATSATLGAGQTETITFTLSEASTDFTAADVTVTGGSIINFSGSGTTYTATYVPDAAFASGTVKVNSNKFSDLAGNFNNDGADTDADTTNIVSIAYQAAPTQTVSFSSMTKDSSLSGANADWYTADGSAGRLVSGTISAPLQSGQKVAVYANGTLIGNATVVGKAWEITDLNAYNANWTYTAKVVDTAGNAGPEAKKDVTTDFTESAPTITSVTDSANTSIIHTGTTANALSTVSGKGAAGNTIYLYDNTGTNLVGTTTVDSGGNWTISVANAAGVGAGSNTFSARQVDALGNSSLLSNLWTVTSTGGTEIMVNGNFSSAVGTGYTTTVPVLGSPTNQNVSAYTVQTAATGLNVATTTTSANTNYAYGSWGKKYAITTTNFASPDGAFVGNNIIGQVQSNVVETLWGQSVNVVAGKTYTFKFDYFVNGFNTQGLTVNVDGASITAVGTSSSSPYETGHFYATYTATSSKTISLSLTAAHTLQPIGDYILDNMSFKESAPMADNSLASGTAPFTPNTDGTSTAITYTGGAADMLDGNDVLNIGTNAQTLLSTAGNFIDGSGGVDTLKLATGTVLNLEALTSTQTVKTITQVEVVQMQSNSLLALSANDVLSLGGTNTGTTAANSSTASPMAPYSFDATSAGNGSNSGPGTTSANKVQFVVQGTSSDTLVLNDLKLDGVTTNSTVGNTGLSGLWEYKGTVTVPRTAFSVDDQAHTYKVYNHSTTNAQVLVDSTMKVLVDDSTTITTTAAFSSMTKDSSTAAAHADWLTSDGSAGRLVSGTLSATLDANEVVKVYANGSLIGNATVVGKAWEITDLNGYTGNWAYTAQVVNTSAPSTGGAMTTQAVTLDNTESAPFITSVTDSASASIANNGSTTNTLSTVSGTGNAGNTIYLYDNTGTNLVGTTTVAANGTWSISGLATNTAVGSGSNTFSARQVDALGNASVLSNLWTVTAGGTNLFVNGDLSLGNTGFTSSGNYNPTGTSNTTGGIYDNPTPDYNVTNSFLSYDAITTTTSTAGGTVGGINWGTKYITGGTKLINPDGTMDGNVLFGGLVSTTPHQVIWSQNVNVVAGQRYSFTFDYWHIGAWLEASIGGVTIPFYQTGTTTTTHEGGHFTATFTASSTGPLELSVRGKGNGSGPATGNFALDNFSVAGMPPASDNSLQNNVTAPFTTGVDGVSPVATYTGGAADMLDGNDVLNIGTNAQTLLSTAGNFIDGSGGVDTLKLATGTVLNLEALTNTQTVKTITQVEVIQLQANSLLALSANDVLSLGGTNTGTTVANSSTASPMAPFSFAATSTGSSGAGTTSKDKVQFVVQGTSSDTLVLNDLKLDGVTTNNTVGNTGLGGKWEEKGTVTLTGVDNVSRPYKVYNHSTTNAQVLVDSTMKVLVDDSTTITTTAAFSSMTKDSSLSTAHADWTTSDGSAGRLVSGTLSADLGPNEVVKVYSNGTLIGEARVEGRAWVITDLNVYTGNWAYTTQVTSSSGGGAMSTQQVTLETVLPPEITGVLDAAGASVGATGTNASNIKSTYKTLSSVSGTGEAGSVLYLYDNSLGNLVGSTTVSSDGTWTVTSLTNVGAGRNSFAAIQVDPTGATSNLSNLWTVSSSGDNVLSGVDYESQTQSGLGGSLNTSFDFLNQSWIWRYVNAPTATVAPTSTKTGTATTATNRSSISWTNDIVASSWTAPNNGFSGKMIQGTLNNQNAKLWGNTVNVEAGTTYEFMFAYTQSDVVYGESMNARIDGTRINFSGIANNTGGGRESGVFKATYTAAETKAINLEVWMKNNGAQQGYGGDYQLDSFSFSEATASPDGSLGLQAPTQNPDNLEYTAGALNALDGNDVITADASLPDTLSQGGFINGGAGIDSLKLAAGTTLDLTAITNNQTVKSIQQVEVFELQGGSTLTLSANSVLSLGAKDAFSGTAGKVQLLIKGQSTDNVSLQNLLSDGAGGNTGLAGMWSKDASQVTLTGTHAGTYNVYTHSTTGAQVLISSAVPDNRVTLAASPLVIDLNGDGVLTTTLANGVLFDLVATGSPQATAWVDRHDGLLAIDLNGDGVVNSGAELLGSSTRLADGSLARDGWQALAQYDANADGQIDLNDAVFNQLRVWVDTDTDGTTDAGELRTLAEAGVQRISLQRDDSQTEQNGNVLDGQAAVAFADGRTTQMSDAWFSVQQPAVLNLDAVVHDQGLVNLADGQAQVLKLNVSDVLQLLDRHGLQPRDDAGVGLAADDDSSVIASEARQSLVITGDRNDMVTLSQLFADGHTEGQWAAQGQVTQNGQTFNVYQYSGDASLQVLIDQHIAQVQLG